MNPQTTEGIAANSSIRILHISFNLGPQNSETKIAAPRPNGTAMIMAKTVTLNVPMIRAKTP